ncbi:arsenic resistance N-acetyltransferase ArsN2 [Trinickia caryophylli]|uniref:Amino-acid N-acetyltransferase n=1 Tax=Trinickia caryophylli TaxID=28094 RepID=A0A1X7ET23_TRICW|nr:arsenic resistance N-acetyltransferase ArsN2 [Trinickia caryophylli]WQE10596.1 arsenic resistance N-acetyltransferase ArsN2 [Trinickia caryophylli]GLU32958.1 GNAT family N-acetyltransferase [Trinickia caryophylli]SMF39128.1 amino-acid N-acetyltransferase [Trinickia caryophylli]
MNAIRPGHSGDYEAIVSLLERDGLPVADCLPEPPVELRFFVAEDPVESRLAGCIGLQHVGEVGLVRSFVVSPDHRNRGIGAQLLEALHAHARRTGMSQLYLLTTTASAFFARHGYRAIPRETAPAAIRASTEFSSLCPASAVLMTRSL